MRAYFQADDIEIARDRLDRCPGPYLMTRKPDQTVVFDLVRCSMIGIKEIVIDADIIFKNKKGPVFSDAAFPEQIVAGVASQFT